MENQFLEKKYSQELYDKVKSLIDSNDSEEFFAVFFQLLQEKFKEGDFFDVLDISDALDGRDVSRMILKEAILHSEQKILISLIK